jgi:hypothetical protein
LLATADGPVGVSFVGLKLSPIIFMAAALDFVALFESLSVLVALDAGISNNVIFADFTSTVSDAGCDFSFGVNYDSFVS